MAAKGKKRKNGSKPVTPKQEPSFLSDLIPVEKMIKAKQAKNPNQNKKKKKKAPEPKREPMPAKRPKADPAQRQAEQAEKQKKKEERRAEQLQAREAAQRKAQEKSQEGRERKKEKKDEARESERRQTVVQKEGVPTQESAGAQTPPTEEVQKPKSKRRRPPKRERMARAAAEAEEAARREREAAEAEEPKLPEPQPEELPEPEAPERKPAPAPEIPETIPEEEAAPEIRAAEPEEAPVSVPEGEEAPPEPKAQETEPEKEPAPKAQETEPEEEPVSEPEAEEAERDQKTAEAPAQKPKEESRRKTAREQRQAEVEKARERKAAAERAREERKAAAERAKEERLAAAERAKEERLAAAERAKEERLAAAERAREERKAAAERAKEEQKAKAQQAREQRRAEAEKVRERKAAAERAKEDRKAAAEKAKEDRKAAAERAREERLAAAERAKEEQKAKAEQAREQRKAAAEKAREDRKAKEARKAEAARQAREERKAKAEEIRKRREAEAEEARERRKKEPRRKKGKPQPEGKRVQQRTSQAVARKRWGILFSLLTVVLGPVLVLWLTQAVWLQSLTEPFPWMMDYPGSLGLFWVLFSVVSLSLYGLTRRLALAYLPPAAALLFLSLVSRYKMDINGEPLKLSDTSFLGAMGDIAGYAASQLIPSVTTILVLVFTLVWGILLVRWDRWRPPLVPWLLLGCLCVVLLVSGLRPGPLQDAAVELDRGCQDQLERNGREGVPLGLYAAWSQRQRIASGEGGPDVNALISLFREDWEAQVSPVNLEEAPDIVFITSESFYDITRLPNLYFEEDPLPTFHALSQTCTNGRFLSNTFGGGTGTVEMSMFTGLTNTLLKEGDTLCTLEPAVYKTIPSTVRLAERLGYTTTAFHSHTDRLYNRREVYPLIGFQKVLFSEDFHEEPEQRGRFISDESFARELITLYEERDKSKPMFLYGLSMENHQPFFAEKYSEPSGFPAWSPKLDAADLAIVDSLVNGLHSADRSLEILTDYFAKVERPVVLVFVGDHLPGLRMADEVTFYCKLGYTPTESSADWDAETLQGILSTDYIIWTNFETEAAPDRTDSCTYLGMRALQRAGLPLDQYFTWLDRQLAPRMMLTRGRFFADQDGKGSYQVPADFQPTLDAYSALELDLAYLEP